jgi:hypothetical protein
MKKIATSTAVILVMLGGLVGQALLALPTALLMILG